MQGSFDALTAEGMLISEGEAKRKLVSLGDGFDVRIDGDRSCRSTVQGIYDTSRLHPGAHVPPRHVRGHAVIVDTAGFVSLTRADGVGDEAIPRGGRRQCRVVRHRRAAGQARSSSTVAPTRRPSLAFVYGLLLLSIVIAVFGIVLTLLLAVYERRRETGLLRAVGMTRAQVRTTVRWESVITSVYGAVVGVMMGLLLGYVVIVALRDEGLTKYSVPVPTIGAILLIAFVVGVIAAVVPAWRATKLDILQAIATE